MKLRLAPFYAWLMAGLAALPPSARASDSSAVGSVQEQSRSHREELAQIFREATQHSWAQRIAGLGGGAVPDLFEVLSTRRIETGKESVGLTNNQEQAVLRAFRELPAGSVRAVLRSLVQGEPLLPEERAAAVSILSEMGDPQDAALLAQITSSGFDRSIPRPDRITFRRVLETLLKRRPEELGVLVPLYEEAHPSLLHPIVEVAGHEDSARSLRVLGQFLGKKPEVDPLILSELARLGTQLPHPLDRSVLDSVRKNLRHHDVRTLLATVDAAAKLEDFEAIPLLIELLDHPYDNVRDKAREGLKTVTGRQFGYESEVWGEWYTKELDWWRQRAPRELELIESGLPHQVSEGLMNLSRRRIFRHALVAPFATALDREESDLQILACASLGYLSSHLAVVDLIHCLKKENVEVRMAAWKALRKITGHDLPAEYGAWEPLLERYADLQR